MDEEVKQSAADFLTGILLTLASRAAQGAAYETWDDRFARKEVREVWADEESVFRRKQTRRVTVDELRDIPDDKLRALGFASWDDDLTLIPLWAFNYIADGEALDCINGSVGIKGTDKLDMDTRGGCIAHGFRAAISRATGGEK